MSKLIINIKELIQVRDKNTSYITAKEMDILPSINNAYLLIDKGKISEFGNMGLLKYCFLYADIEAFVLGVIICSKLSEYCFVFTLFSFSVVLFAM